MGGDFTLVRNGFGFPTVRSHTVTGLSTGLPYRFYAVSENFVGKSSASSYFTFYSCVSPSG